MTFSDSRISKYLQEHFIVQWEAVSPVRLVKFDLGEGRSFSGTVNGEIAIHFCNSDGKVFDILPALQSPAVTLNAIKEAHTFFKEHTKEEKNVKEHGGSYSLYTKIMKFHRERLQKVAAKRYDSLVEKGVKIYKDPENIPSSRIFPKSKKGEEKRDAYIYSAVDDATRDMRTMVTSKVGPPPNHFKSSTFSQEALTVVEPGGLGYYQWQIDRGFLGKFDNPLLGMVENMDEKDPNEILTIPARPPEFILPANSALKTPQEWKLQLFTGIMKQELKGGVVEYNSESLEAIQIME